MEVGLGRAPLAGDEGQAEGESGELRCQAGKLLMKGLQDMGTPFTAEEKEIIQAGKTELIKQLKKAGIVNENNEPIV